MRGSAVMQGGEMDHAARVSCTVDSHVFGLLAIGAARLSTDYRYRGSMIRCLCQGQHQLTMLVRPRSRHDMLGAVSWRRAPATCVHQHVTG